jgi:arylsulfatase A
MPRKPFPLALVLLAVLPLSPGAAGARTLEPSRPNLVLVLADDMGYECVGANGGASYRTPELDRLAAEGLRFTRCYSQPLCTPTRVQLLTGLYNQRNYVRFGELKPGALTFAQILRRAGYRTCVAGKWQLAGGAEAPARFGFDEHLLWQLTVRRSRHANPVLEKDGKVLEFRGGEYGEDLIADFVCDFITRHRERPFLVFYSMLLPHAPFEPTPASADWDPRASEGSKPSDPRRFADMVAYLDRSLGRVLRRIDELGLGERTLILFTADNGTGRPLRSRLGEREIAGGKGEMTEAGTHVPLLARWSGRIARGGVCGDLIDSTDFLPTLLEAAGVAPRDDERFDGRSFVPQLLGRPGAARPWTYSWYARDGGEVGREAARNARWKLYADGALFDLAADPAEMRDLRAEELAGEAASARSFLREALENFRGTRGLPPAYGATERAVVEEVWARTRELGGKVFWKEGRLVELVLNGKAVRDADLERVALIDDLTDLSLEQTEVGDAGLVSLGRLRRLEWLNLYRTQAGDATLAALKDVASLRKLPIGGTRVTDAGLAHIAGLKQLEYLGLRENAIGDEGLRHLAALVALKGLHLGGTRISAAGLRHLEALGALEELWLDATAIGDDAVEPLAKLKSLRRLHLASVPMGAAARARLRAALPDTVIEPE